MGKRSNKFNDGKNVSAYQKIRKVFEKNPYEKNELSAAKKMKNI